MTHEPGKEDLNLGSGHLLFWTEWSIDNVDLALNPQYSDIPPLAAGEHYGATIRHPAGSDVKSWATEFYGEGVCSGSVTFDTATARALDEVSAIGGKARWQVLGSAHHLAVDPVRLRGPWIHPGRVVWMPA